MRLPAGGAVILPAPPNVAVDIQGKGCGSVPKIALHRLDIIPILKEEDSERVLQ